MIVTIILLLIFCVVGFVVGKYLAEQKKWGTKKAELEKDFGKIKYELEKELFEAEKGEDGRMKELMLEHQKNMYEIQESGEKRLNEMKERFMELIKGHRKDAVERSRNVIMGKLWETIAPYIPKFKYSPADMKFIGAPIDYIVFEGMSKKSIESVVFLEVKSGSSKLNAQEKKLKEAIQNKRVKWEEFRLDEFSSTVAIEDKLLEKDVKKELDEIEEGISK